MQVFRFVQPLALLLLLLPAGRDCPAGDQPNVLLVMTDDQGFGDFSLHGNPILNTPNTDQFARNGIQFERFYVNPFCAPTRASLLTGRYSLRTGVWSVTHNKEAMRSSEVTIAEALRENGYRTACIGKWHNGGHYPRTANGQGFDDFFGFNHGHINQYFNSELLRGSKPEQTNGYITDVLTDEAIKFIADNKESPFFCYVSYNAPHTPCQVPGEWFDPFLAKGLDPKLAAIYGMCANLDHNFGRLLQALDDAELRENTIVLFLTDNGANSDRFNAGMRGRKVSVHEGGSRVPLFVQWPRRFYKPKVVRQLAAHFDLYPTILGLCGAKAPAGPPLDGVSLVPLLDNPDSEWSPRLLFTNTDMGNKPRPFPGAVRSDRYRLVHARKSTTWELFDMHADPGETNDISATHPDKVAELTTAYMNWWNVAHKGAYERMSIPVGYDEQNPVVLNASDGEPDKLNYHHGPGFAHDWLVGWTTTDASASWEIDVVEAGMYQVELQYLCPEADAGSRIKVRCGKSVVDAITTGKTISDLPLSHRDEDEHGKYINRDWSTLRPGVLQLQKGRQRLKVFATSKPGETVMELKSVVLTKQ